MRLSRLIPWWWFVVGSLAAQESEPRYYQLNWQAFYRLPAVQQTLNLRQPDYALLDAAIFHATNEARGSQHLSPLLYAPSLHQAATSHAQSMIDLDFYGHENHFEPVHFKSDWRIQAFGGDFGITGENIAQVETMDTPYVYGVRKLLGGTFEYLDTQKELVCKPYTYLAYARRVVNAWMNSEHHRATILSPSYQFVGCAARLSKNPFSARNAPFARPVQEFGGYIHSAKQAMAGEER